LLFLVGKAKKFMSLEVANGTILFQYDLGAGPARLQTSDMYNDGQWHTIEAVRYRKDSNLIVDRQRITGSSPGNPIYLAISDYMYFGGYPGEHEFASVSKKSFEGCIEQVTIDQAPVDLTQAVETRYTVVGCPSSQFAPTVATFFGQGYLQVSSADSPVSGRILKSIENSVFFK
jgi:laminin alpha 3/5